MKASVQNSRARGKRITWKDEEGNLIDLTGAVITCRIKNLRTGTVTNSDGTFTVVNPGTSGVFTWAFGAVDVGTAGDFQVQFKATYPSTLTELSLTDTWVILPAQ